MWAVQSNPGQVGQVIIDLADLLLCFRNKCSPVLVHIAEESISEHCFADAFFRNMDQRRGFGIMLEVNLCGCRRKR